MATIGNFKKQDNGSFSGRIETLTINTAACIEANKSKKGDNAPDFRVMLLDNEIGAAWSKTSKAGETYLSVSIDDPTFPMPLYCRLVKSGAEKGYSLLWDRRKPREE